MYIIREGDRSSGLAQHLKNHVQVTSNLGLSLTVLKFKQNKMDLVMCHTFRYIATIGDHLSGPAQHSENTVPVHCLYTDHEGDTIASQAVSQ
jgi:hypothetical protein